MVTARPSLLALCVALGGCGAEPSDDPGSAPPATVDTPEADVEETPAVDTVDTVDTPPPADTDTVAPVDTPADTPAPLEDPPADWGAGFVDISGTLLTADAYPVSAGDRATGIAPDVTVGQWIDLDEDGTSEVVITTRTSSGTSRVTDKRVYRWQGGELVRDTTWEARLPALTSALLLGLDLDDDGQAELIQADSEPLYWGDGRGRWTGPVSFTEDNNRVAWTLAAAPWDFDHDGRLDLLTGDGTCDHAITPFLQDEVGELVRHGERVPSNPGGGLRPDAILPFELPDGRAVLTAVGITCDIARAHPGFLVEDAPDAGTFTAVDLVPRTSLLKVSLPWPGFPFTVWAPMGASVTDLDSDGVLDLLLSLGFDYVTVLQGQLDGSFVDRTVDANMLSYRREWGTTEIMWSLAHPDLDQDGRSDVLLTYGDDLTSFHLADGATVATRAWWNGGDFRFVDVGAATHVDVPGGWKTLAMDDPDRDGDADLLIGGRGMLPRVLRNDIETGRHGFSLALRGTVSNHLGIGAMVDVEVGGLPVQHRMMGNEGNCGGGSPPLLFYGTKDATSVDLVRVRWPSGYVQEVRGLGVDTLHTITEPPLYEIFPRTRSVVADGQAIVQVNMMAFDAAGVADRNASVALDLAGSGTVEGPTWTGATWLFLIHAPAAPGEAELTFRYNGAPLRTRPRIRWTAP